MSGGKDNIYHLKKINNLLIMPIHTHNVWQ